MRRDKPPYYKVKNGRVFFQLGRERAASAGMDSSTPLGLDGPKPRATAWAMYYEWREKSGKGDLAPEKKAYPKGSLGSFFETYRRTAAWRQESPQHSNRMVQLLEIHFPAIW